MTHGNGFGKDSENDGLRLGPKSREWLHRVGIRSAEDLRSMGVDEAYQLVVEAGHPPNKNFYYGLVATVLGVDWREAKLILEQDPDAVQRPD